MERINLKNIILVPVLAVSCWVFGYVSHEKVFVTDINGEFKTLTEFNMVLQASYQLCSKNSFEVKELLEGCMYYLEASQKGCLRATVSPLEGIVGQHSATLLGVEKSSKGVLWEL